MAKFKVSFSGFVYVEADNAEEAEEMYEEGDTIYEESQIDEVREVDEFTIDL